MVSSDLMDRHGATDRHHGDSDLEFGALGALVLIGGSPGQGRYPASEVKDEAYPENRSTSLIHQAKCNIIGTHGNEIYPETGCDV